MIPFRFEKTAHAPMPQAQIPGGLVHCLSCGQEIPKTTPRCPHCGSDMSRVGGDNSPETGGEAASLPETPEVGAGAKLASAFPVLKSAVGGVALAGGAMTAGSLMPTFRQAELDARKQRAMQLVIEGKLPEQELLKYQHVKMAARSGANPILNIRKALKKLQKSTSEYRASVVFKKK